MTHIDLPGLWNLRQSRPGLFRSDALHRLDELAWQRLTELGVRTVVDLRTTDESAKEPTRAPGHVEIVACPLEDGLHATPLFETWFRTGEIGTPLYYPGFCERWPDRVANALDAVESRRPGVLVHCSKGCDRTGMIIALVLDREGVDRQEIIADYLATGPRLELPAARALDIRNDNPAIDEVMRRAGMSLSTALERFLDGYTAV